MAIIKHFPIGTAIIGGLFLLVMLATYLLVKPPPPPAELQGVMRQEFRQLYPFSLNASDGNQFTQNSLQSKWSFVFFGYISCPDICPATLYVLEQVNAQLRDDAILKKDDYQFVFVSVDPQRDTAKKLQDYVGYFNKDFIGVTGDKTAIDNFTKQLGAGYVIEAELSEGVYNVIHTAAIFLIDPLGRPVASFSQPHYSSTIHSQFMKIEKYFSGT